MFVCAQAGGQFTPGLLANDSYWSDGKAEFDIYDAQLMRDAQPRHCELLMIFARESINPKNFARVDDPKGPDAISTIRMSEMWTAPIGLFAEQMSLSAHWRSDGVLLRLLLSGSDSFGNIVRKVESGASAPNFWSDTYRDGASASTISPAANSFFYEELPLRVRTIDWRKSAAAFEVQLAAPLARAKTPEFKPAKISWKLLDKSVAVTVQHLSGTDSFLLDQQFPFLLRDWQMADGSKLHLKRGLKADYWNYGKNGDRERALKNPMLEHPD